MGNFALQRIGMVSNHLHNITKILDRLQRIEEQLPHQPKLHEALKAAYADILRFYLEVIRYLRKDIWCKYSVVKIICIPVAYIFSRAYRDDVA